MFTSIRKLCFKKINSDFTGIGTKAIKEEEVIKCEKMALSAVIVWKCNLIFNLISHH